MGTMTEPRSVGCVGRLRTLIADGSALGRRSLSLFVRANRDLNLVGCVSDGQQAIKLAAALRPDLVLMALELPQRNGVDATRQIKLRADAPVVVMLADDDWACRAISLIGGADAFIARRGIPTQLAPLLGRLLGLPSYQRETP